MQVNWIKINCTLPTNPKVVTLASRWNVTRVTVLGQLCLFWILVDQHSEGGKLKNLDKKALDFLMELEGFAEGMEAVGWLKQVGETEWEIVGYEAHNGPAAKSRALAAARKKKERHGAVTKERDQNRIEENRIYTPKSPNGEKEKKGNKNLKALDPLHVRIIRCITPRSKCERPRDSAELRAWQKVKGHVTEADVVALEAFYGMAKGAECDATWRRKNGVTALLNQLTEQVELAREFAAGGARVKTDRVMADLSNRYEGEGAL
jgi:hypothetical protein